MRGWWYLAGTILLPFSVTCLQGLMLTGCVLPPRCAFLDERCVFLQPDWNLLSDYISCLSVQVLRPLGTSLPFPGKPTADQPIFTYSKRHTKSHTLCRRCGNRAFHRQHKSAYFASLLHRYQWVDWYRSFRSLRTMRIPLC